MEAPRIQDMFEDYQNQGLMVLAIGYHQSVESCVEWKNRHFLTHPVLSDPTGMITLQYVPNAGGVHLPHSVIVDPNQVVQYTEIGFQDTTIYHILDSLMTPELAFHPDHLDFGDIMEGLPARRTLILDNIGTGILEVTSITSQRPDVAMYPTTGAIEAYNDSLAISVTITPSHGGAFLDTLCIFSTGGDGIVTISGSACAVELRDLVITWADSCLTLSWTPVLGAQGYNIYSSDNPDVTPSPANLLIYALSNSYTDSTIVSQPGIISKYYCVTAIFLR